MHASTSSGRGRPTLSLPGHGHGPHVPSLRRWPVIRTVAGRTFPRLVEADLAPAAILLVVVACADMGVAMVAVLAWTLGAVAWRLARRRALPGLLLLAAIGVTVRT